MNYKVADTVIREIFG